MPGRKEYTLKIKIAGSVDPSLTKSISSIGDSLKGGIGKLDGAFNQLDPAFDKLEAAGKKCFEAIAVAAGAAATAIGIVGQQVLEAGMAFEQQMSTVEAISGADAAQKAALEDRAREIARTTKFTAEEVGEAYEYMGMAGWKTEEMLNGVNAVMSLAAASGEELGLVSDIVTDDLTAFGKSAEDAAHFADILAATATNSNTNVAMMGDTFKYAAPLAGTLGYSIEDVAIATGLMANNGIKADMAGTSLRNLFQRMAKPTKESAAAMTDLNLAIEDSEGKMLPFMDVMQQLRETLGGKINESSGFLEYMEELNTAFEEGKITEEEFTASMDEYIAKNDELSQSESVKLAAMLAGARGMAGLLAIVNASTEDFNALTEAIYGCEGAAEEMSKVKLDNLQGDVDIFNSALNELKLSIYDEVNPALRGLVDYGTEIVNSVGTWLPEMIGDIAENIEEKLPQAIQKVKDVGGPLLEGVQTMFGFFMDHGEEVVGVFAGIGTAIVTYEIASNVTHIVEWLLKLDPISITIAAITASVGLIAGYLTTIRLEHEALVEQNLADHFGDISLSLSELQEIADQVAGSGQLERIRNVLDEFSTLEETKKGLEDIQKTLDKADWKVSVGLVLHEDDLQAYKTNVEALVTQTQKLLQDSFNVDIASAGEGMTDSSGLIGRLSQFYEAKQGELSTLGTQLNNAITSAFEDGFLDFNETKIIANIREKIERIQSEVLADEFDIQMKMLDVMNFGQLDATSYENLMAQLRNANQERVEGLARIYATDVQNAEKVADFKKGKLQDLLNIHEIDEKEFSERYSKIASDLEKDTNNAYDTFLKSKADSYRRVMEGSTGGLMTQYAEEIASAQKIMKEAFNDIAEGFSKEGLKGIAEGSEEYLDSLRDTANALPALLEQMYSLEGIGTSMEGFEKFTEKLKPTEQDVEELKAEFEAAGVQMPQGFIEGMETVDLLMALSGDEGALYNQLLIYLSEEYPQYAEMVESSKMAGGKIPESVAEGMVSPENLAKLDEGAAELYDETKDRVQEKLDEGIDGEVDVNITVNPVIKNLSSIGLAVGGVVGAGATAVGNLIGSHAEGGFVSGKQLSWLAEEGPEVVIPLNDSERAMSLWKQTGEVLDAKSRLDSTDLDEGVTESLVVTYAPVYNISGSGVKRDDVERITQDGFRQFSKYMDEYTKQNNRVRWDRG